MIEIVLAHTDLARMRFAHSPIRELMASLLILRDPGRQHMYATWLSAVRGNIGRLRLDLLTALTPPGQYALDFVIPSPTSPWTTLAEELETVASTPPAVVRTELEFVYQGRPMPAVIRQLHADPASRLPDIVKEMRQYWEVAVEPVWQRLRAISVADLSYRAERFAVGGVARVLKDLHPEINYAKDRLLVGKPRHCKHRVDLTGTGIVLIPCAFSWPTLTVQCCHMDLPTLSYPPRGIAELWGPSQTDEADPLCALLGKTRATLLATLGLPRTTTQLAEQLDLSPATVSQHLKILKGTTLVTARRHGRLVLYQRTAAATALLTAIRSDQRPPADHQKATPARLIEEATTREGEALPVQSATSPGSPARPSQRFGAQPVQIMRRLE